MKIRETQFVCDLEVVSTREREQFSCLTDSLLATVRETRELENGFAFQFPNQPGQLVQIARLIERESQCCPFLEFHLEVEPSGGPLWLRISGPKGTKDFLEAELDQIRHLERS